MKQERMNILLTGHPGVGKTTAIKSIVNQLKPGIASGFWTLEIRQSGQRIGFAIETLSGKSGILARVGIRGPRVGKYGVNIENIESIIVPELRIARESGRLIIIDEIAKMELYSHQFAEEVEACLETRNVLGTIQARDYQYLNKIRSRQDVRILEVTESNRDNIPNSVYNILKQYEILGEN